MYGAVRAPPPPQPPPPGLTLALADVINHGKTHRRAEINKLSKWSADKKFGKINEGLKVWRAEGLKGIASPKTAVYKLHCELGLTKQ